MTDEPNARERRALEGMAACPYKFELRENLGPAGSQTLASLGVRGWAVGGPCPVNPESNGWAITDLGQKVLDACHAREQAQLSHNTRLITPEECLQARKLLGWSRSDLAARAHCVTETVINFEDGRYPALKRTRLMLYTALAQAGVMFTDGAAPGVRLRSNAE